MKRLREVQNAYPGAPIIAISGQFGLGVCTAAKAAEVLGVDRVIARACDRYAVLEAVRSLMGPSR